MASVYRATYHLRSHKRDNLIEFVKSMLLTPFVLHSTTPPTAGDPITDVDREEAEIVRSVVQSKRPTTTQSQLSKEASVRESQAQAREYNIQRMAEILGNIEELITEHREMELRGLGKYSRLHRMVPTIGNFYTALPLKEAFLRSRDACMGISGRRYVPPSFNDIRRIMNSAQVMAGAHDLKLITFDGDMTLYDDGKNFTEDNPLTRLLIRLLQKDIHVAIVTAAGYGDKSEKYEGRLSGLLKGFEKARLSEEQVGRFFVLGGECNFLFRCSADDQYKLRFMSNEEYSSSSMRRNWQDEEIEKMLDIAQSNLEICIESMDLDATIIRKERAVGLVPKKKMTREQLDECALSSQLELLKFQKANNVNPADAPIPFCAFNGGNDCWVDIGNKFIGVQILQDYLDAKPSQTFHIGDQFLMTGNDIATRRACCTCWIINPDETQAILQELDDILWKDDDDSNNDQ
ncbi:IMP 5'-nucleotidase [Mycoemilia scoparia]|uniref:IMP-specific 5'-nucleotidase 1 n=1 Tax=Mycoemilia scoparia TaxID=417184 RepID=A0A9W8A0U4_9FUNG|nr:IMP 5'-nucleotidase [Mycoemilia scoparia]